MSLWSEMIDKVADRCRGEVRAMLSEAVKSAKQMGLSTALFILAAMLAFAGFGLLVAAVFIAILLELGAIWAAIICGVIVLAVASVILMITLWLGKS